MTKDALIKNTILPYIKALVATGLLLFLPAGTIYYWQAWVFLALLFIPMMLIAIYLSKRSPELLKRRLQVKEKKPGQGLIAKMFYISVGIFFVISGLDKRFNWSTVPLVIIIVADILFLAAYFFLFLVFKENKYLAHTVVVEEGQQVVSTGPYAVVRHPMYLSELLMFIFAPVALGSYWAIIVNIPLVALLAVRIFTEEKVLLSELKGYHGYIQKTKYRFIPGIL
jgi:protein-S-isoprenylcysteine O-methyltransferase Ste14